MPVYLEKQQLAPPVPDPAEMLRGTQLPVQVETAAGFQVPSVEVQAMGASVIEHTPDGDPAITHAEESNGALLWNELAAMTTEEEPYTYKAKAHPALSRLPTSLPTMRTSEYDSSAINFATGPDMKGILEISGVDPAVIHETEQNGWHLDASKLPKELQRTVLTANLYEAVTMTRDPALKSAATERNSHITPEDIWQPATLHHSTSISKMANILKNGHLGFDFDRFGKPINYHGRIQGRGEVQFGVPWNKIGPDAGHEQKIKDLSFYGHGSGDDGVYLHYTRPEGSYREGEEYMSSYDIKAMSGGMPATEISAITMNCSITDYKTKDNRINKVRDELVDTEMYVPIFTIEGELAYSREDFDADIQAKQAGTYVTEAVRSEQRVAENRERQVQMDKAYRAKEAREAVAKGMSVEEYQAFKATLPPPVF